MSIIKKLSPDVIQKIAAGEIVERPCHILKELIENALDAQATMITISVNNGGKSYICVEDNGYGMNKEDAVFCFEHHATSKLKTFEDLEQLNTYGFRGEALSSISAVSHVYLITKEKESKEATHVTIKDGILKEINTTVASIGTKIEITELFSNIPARKKFLKKETTEMHHIMQLFYACCLQSLSVYFNLIKEDTNIFSCPPVTNLIDRYTQLEGLERSEKMKILEKNERNNITISGIISDPLFTSYDRSDIFIFVNNRWVKNTGLMRAIINGYKNVLPAGKFPRAVIHINLPTQEVDINIAPKKEEVRFLHPKMVEQLIEQSVLKTLEKQVTIIQQNMSQPFFNSHSFDGNKKLNEYITPQQNSFFRQTIFEHKKDTEIPIIEQSTISKQENIVQNNQKISEIYTQNTLQEAQKEIIEHELICLGQFYNTYILASNRDKLYIIDQHAAHERIMFEKIAANNNELLAIRLTFPLLIMFKREELALLLTAEHFFSLCGILIEQFDETNLIITATPAMISQHNLEHLMYDMLILLKENSSLNEQAAKEKLLYNLRASIACKSAIKAGDYLDTLAMNQLISDLSRVNNRFCCPHGRPTMWEITVNELERKFKRKI